MPDRCIILTIPREIRDEIHMALLRTPIASLWGPDEEMKIEKFDSASFNRVVPWRPRRANKAVTSGTFE